MRSFKSKRDASASAISTDASSCVSPPLTSTSQLKKALNKKVKRNNVQPSAAEPSKKKRTEESAMVVGKDQVIKEESVQNCLDSPTDNEPYASTNGADSTAENQRTKKSKTNPEHEIIDLFGRDPAPIETLIKDGFRITFDLILATKTQLSLRLDKLDKRMDRMESLVPKRTNASILGADDLTAKYNLTLPIDEHELFEKFDEKLLLDKAFRHDVKSLLQLSLHPGRMSKSAVVMLKAFMTRNLGIVFVGANPKQGQHSLLKTNFYGIMKEVILNKKIDDVDAQRKLRSDVCSVLSNASKWGKRSAKEQIFETQGEQIVQKESDDDLAPQQHDASDQACLSQREEETSDEEDELEINTTSANTQKFDYLKEIKIDPEFLSE